MVYVPPGSTLNYGAWGSGTNLMDTILAMPGVVKWRADRPKTISIVPITYGREASNTQTGATGQDPFRTGRITASTWSYQPMEGSAPTYQNINYQCGRLYWFNPTDLTVATVFEENYLAMTETCYFEADGPIAAYTVST